MHDVVVIRVDVAEAKAKIYLDDDPRGFEVDLAPKNCQKCLCIEYQAPGVHVYWYDESGDQLHAHARRLQMI